MPYYVPINPEKLLGQALVCLFVTIFDFWAAVGLGRAGAWKWCAIASVIGLLLAASTWGAFSIWNQATSPNRS